MSILNNESFLIYDGEEEMPKEFRVEVRVRNNLILKAMEENGISTIAELCRRASVSQSRLGEVVNLKRSPLNRHGEWQPVVLKVAGALKRLPEELFTREQQELEVPSNRGSFEVSFEEVRGLIASRVGGHTPEAIAQSRELRTAIEKVLGTLTPREERIIRLRFGLGGEEEHTLEEVGKEFGVSRERIRDIEARALLKLKHPSRSQFLLEMVGSGRRNPGSRTIVYRKGKPVALEVRWGRQELDEEVLDAARDEFGAH